MHENDAISFHDGRRNVKIKDHVRDRREKKRRKPTLPSGGFLTVRVAWLPPSVHLAPGEGGKLRTTRLCKYYY